MERSVPGDAAGSGLGIAAAHGVVLQQYKSQVVQLQRQVALMAEEMEVGSSANALAFAGASVYAPHADRMYI